MKRSLLCVAILTLLLVLLDQLYRWLHPEVNVVRASLVAATGLVVLLGLARLPRFPVRPLRGAAALFASALGSVLLIEAGILVSRSPLSAVVHVVILAFAYPLLEALGRSPAGVDLSVR